MTEDTNRFHNIPVDIQKYIIAIVKKETTMYRVSSVELGEAYQKKAEMEHRERCIWIKKYGKYKKMTAEELKKIIKEKTKIKSIYKMKKDELVKIAGDLFDDGINWGKIWFPEYYK